MAKLNPDGWNSRQASALADDEDDAYLRPEVPAGPRRKSGKAGARRGAAADLVPNYESEEADAFLRSRRRVPPRKVGRLRALLGTRIGRILVGVVLVAILIALGMCAWAIRSFLQHDPHFRIDSSASIQSTGNTELSQGELVNVFGSDIGRNVFFVPLAKREAALEAQPWVRHATVMRLLPNTIRVTIEERIPIAFVRIGHQIELVDAEGVLLNMAPATLAARHYSFPVVIGLDPNSTLEARAQRMRLFQKFVAALDAGGTKISTQLSEVDLSDLDDVRAVVPAQGTDILLHFGDSDFLERFQSYQQHLAEWRQQYPNLSAVDLRYDRQVVLKMADAARADQTAEDAEAVKIATQEREAAAKEAAEKAAATRPAMPATVHHAATPVKHAAHATAHAPTHGSAHGHGKTWYTVAKPTAHHPAHWVPHYIPKAGRTQ